MMQTSAKYMCPECGKRGTVVKKSPRTERMCANAHRWADGAKRGPPVYVPLGVRLDEAVKALRVALSALDHSGIIIKDCASLMTREQSGKLSLNYELHQIETVKTYLNEVIVSTGIEK